MNAGRSCQPLRVEEATGLYSRLVFGGTAVPAPPPCLLRRPPFREAPQSELGRRFQRLGTLDALAIARRMQRVPQIGPPLHIQPEIRAVAEHPGKDKCRRSGDAASPGAQLIDVLP